MSRALPYAKKLEQRQRRGDRPWLVFVAVGDDSAWRATYRRLLAPGDPGVERLWWPDDAAHLDLAPLIGTDVLVADSGAGQARTNEVLYMLWRGASLSTLWLLQHPDKQWLHLSPAWAQFRAAQVVASPVRLRGDPLILDGIGHPVNAGLREHVAQARQAALFHGDPPLFDRPQFMPAREQRLRELGLDPLSFARQCAA
jgi:hypothetical protein